MDSIFLLQEGDRGDILQHIMQFFGCTYICLWQYLPHPSNCLLFLDGLCRGVGNDRPSSSSSPGESCTRRLFDQYRQAVFNIIDSNGVPGLAFRNHNHFMKLTLVELQRVASIEVQLQFYQEAGIKMSVFMGCNNGEIELGFPRNDTPVDLEMMMTNWFPQDFSRLIVGGQPREISTDQNLASSSSIMPSLSIASPELYSPLPLPLLFNIPTSSTPIQTSTPTAQTIQALSRIRNVRLPNKESEDAILTNAMIDVLTTSTPSSSSSSRQSQQNMPPNYRVQPNEATAFRRYNNARSSLVPASARTQMSSMFKRAITFYRRLAYIQRQEQLQRGGQRRSTLHMISERRRREKLNENFQVLRSLLPPRTKKDKASVLASSAEYLSSLKAQVTELAQRNQILETQPLLPREKVRGQDGAGSSMASTSNRERMVVCIIPVDQSTSEVGRVVDLQVSVLMGQSFSLLDLATCVLEFLKKVNNVSVMSIEANTRAMLESNSLNSISVRLRIEIDEWNESAFQEAIRRIVADFAKY